MAAQNCSAVSRLLEMHFNGTAQRRGARTVVSFHGGNGVGDEVNGLLLALVASMDTVV